MAALRVALSLLVLFALDGCSSVAKGVTEAFLEQPEAEDQRACHIEGPAFPGLEAKLRKQEQARNSDGSAGTLKILMVHGIGKHIPGYSGRLTQHLMSKLGLGVREASNKTFALRDSRLGDQSLGQLTVSRYTNDRRTRELIFYELTWSEIIEKEKQIIAFDDSTEYTSRRTPINAALKGFFNSHFPDPILYLGESHDAILASVQQSFCWMTSGDWQDYPSAGEASCDVFSAARLKQFEEDDFAFVTHSLGSRVMIDVAQELGEWSAQQTDPGFIAMRELWQNRELSLYMMANQLPLLELGRKRAAVRGEIDAYCRPGGKHYQKRLFGRMAIFAFSDPNDLLSYPVPPNFVDRYMDSRLCPRITNVTLNVAEPVSLFGVSDFANPLAAHGGYDQDERVVALMAHGLGQAGTAEVVKQRCTWLQTVED